MSEPARRHTKDEINGIRAAILEIVAVDSPWTIRGIYYQLVWRKLVAKTENAYNNTVVVQAVKMRLGGALPWEAIADHGREVDWNRHYANAKERITGWLNSAPNPETFERDMWANQACMVMVFLEKDALAGILGPVCEELHVPLVVTRGYPSITLLHDVAEAIADDGRPHFIYQIGDHDPAGTDIPRNIEARLREFAPEIDLTFQRLAVTPEQIVELELPTRPTKRNDQRGKSFKGDSVEVDAIPPGALRELLRVAILRHREQDLYEKHSRAQNRDRRQLKTFSRRVAALVG
jgi:hypothetical protein